MIDNDGIIFPIAGGGTDNTFRTNGDLATSWSLQINGIASNSNGLLPPPTSFTFHPFSTTYSLPDLTRHRVVYLDRKLCNETVILVRS